MIDKDQLIDGMVRFSTGSMEWCGQESEEAVSSVITVMDMLMDDARRISSMSEDTLGAVREFRKKIATIQEKKNADHLDHQLNTTQLLIQELSRLTHEHEEISELVRPIVGVLQFQDRITQNMQNLQGMIRAWQETRQQIEQSGNFDTEARNAFGLALYQHTTMEEERRPMRELFDGLPAESNEQYGGNNDDVFF